MTPPRNRRALPSLSQSPLAVKASFAAHASSAVEQYPTRMTLDVVMENFWGTAHRVLHKPVWLGLDVLQLVYDDDNDALHRISDPGLGKQMGCMLDTLG